MKLWIALALLLAPLQCGAPPREHPEYEDSPAEAVWDLSEELGEAGDAAGRRRALEFLIERYPSSRFAERARVVLERESPRPESPEPDAPDRDAPERGSSDRAPAP